VLLVLANVLTRANGLSAFASVTTIGSSERSVFFAAGGFSAPGELANESSSKSLGSKSASESSELQFERALVFANGDEACGFVS